MKAHAPKQSQPQQQDSLHHSLLRRRTIEDQTTQRSPQAHTEGLEAASATTAAPTRFAHDFSRIPMSSRAPVRLQAKLTVNTPGDIYEQEADRVAEQVMATPAHQAVSGAPPHIQRLAGQPIGLAGVTTPASVDGALAAPGRPLEPALRQDMEKRFGHDFSRVRVHSGAVAEQSAQDVDAKAYTVGHDIVFGAGRFTEGTNEGRRLIAHELTHVVQQSGVARHGVWDSAGRVSASALSVQRAPGPTRAHAPSPPSWLGSWGASAVHVQGDIWDVKLPSLGGDSWVGPYNQLQAYIKKQGFAGKMEAAHIVGGEHLNDIRSAFSYDKAPCIAVDKSLHATWTTGTANLQSRQGPMGGRATKTQGRPVVTGKDVIGLYDELYRSHPELQEMARNIVEPPGGGAGKRLVPAHGSVAARTAKVGEDVTAKVGQTSAKVENAVADAVGMEAKVATRLSRINALAKVGYLGFHFLLPGPLDVFMLIIQFAGSYAEAHEAIRSRNTRTGFAIGLSASLLGRSFGAVRKHLARKFILDREVHTQVVGAVGMAETSHNAGLSAGFHYGEILSDDAKDTLREVGFSALKAQVSPPEWEELLTARGVWQFAKTLLPTVDQIFEAMRVEAEKKREEEERKRHMERGQRGMKV